MSIVCLLSITFNNLYISNSSETQNHVMSLNSYKWTAVCYVPELIGTRGETLVNLNTKWEKKKVGSVCDNVE